MVEALAPDGVLMDNWWACYYVALLSAKNPR